MRRLGLLFLTVVGLLLPAGPAAADTTVTVKGNVITITMTVDVVGAADKHATAPNGQPLVDYWNQVLQDTWGAAFDRLPYKGCFKLALKVKLTARKATFDAKEGNHRIIVGAASGGSFEGTGFDGASETTRNSKTGDGTRSFEHDRDGAIPVDAPPTVVAHEFGHLFGLGDDRANGAPKNGRDGTMMVGGVPGVDVNVVQEIDQNLIDRIGKAITNDLENQGKKLPKCEVWEGTMKTTLIQVGDVNPDACPGPDEIRGTARFVVNANGKVTGTYDLTGCNVSQPHAEFTGTATDEGFTFPQVIVQTNGELIPKVGPKRARATLTNFQDGGTGSGTRYVTKWDMRCVDNCGEAAAVG
jgi:hypothetical protein